MEEKTLREELIKRTSSRVVDTLDALQEYVGSTFKDDADLFEAIKSADDRLDDACHEIADGMVDVYTANQLEWLAANVGRADQENAIACGAKSAQEIAAYCWYEANRDDLRDDIAEIANVLNDEEEK